MQRILAQLQTPVIRWD